MLDLYFLCKVTQVVVIDRLNRRGIKLLVCRRPAKNRFSVLRYGGEARSAEGVLEDFESEFQCVSNQS